jgi:hypothetical protein
MSRSLVLVHSAAACLAAVAGAAAAGDAADHAAAPVNPDVVELPVEGWRIATWASEGANHYALDFDGGGFDHMRETTYTLRLRYAEFDPLEGAPPSPPGFDEIGGGEPGEGAYIVQFITQPLPPYRRDLARMGAVVYKFLADHAYVVGMSDDVAEAVSALPYVRWVGEFRPEYKLEESILAGLADDAVELPPARYRIQVFARGLAQKQSVAERIAEVRRSGARSTR